jgi:branched-chain amino acid transport system ATP-binding protein
VRAITAEGLTVLAAGQHVRRLLRLATRGYLLDEGRVVLSGPGRQVLEDERLRDTLLEVGPRPGGPGADAPGTRRS